MLIWNGYKSLLEGRTGLNNHLKLFRTVTLCGADQGFKSLKLLLFEIWATPYFQSCDFSRKMKNLYFIRFLQVRHHILGFLTWETHYNYCFYDRTFTFRYMGHAFFWTHRFSWKTKNLFLIFTSFQHFLWHKKMGATIFLTWESHCNYCFYDITFTFWDMGHTSFWT